MRGRLSGTLRAVALLGFAGCGAPPEEPAELVLLGGRIVTLDPARPVATALAARDGRIVAVGDDAAIEPFVGPATRTILLDGKLAVPGFIEGHGHFTGLGRSLAMLRLGEAGTWDEIVAQVAVAARDARPGEWIVGRGWHQDKWSAPPRPAVEGYPTLDALSSAAPENPVVLRHASGHGVIANRKALELAGITRDTPDPEGGRILRDARGAPTGMLRERAAGLVATLQEEADRERFAELTRRDIELANRECLEHGITSFQDAGSSLETIALVREAAESGALGVRLWVMLGDDNERLAREAASQRVIGAANDHLTVRAIKRYLDGALGTHGAWLLEPYVDLPGSVGHETYPLADIERAAEIALEHDLQLCVHAIGDRANREVLNVYERALASRPNGKERRWRVEHAQHVDPADVPRFAQLGVIPSMQTVHCTSDGPWVPSRLGEPRAGAGGYVWRSLLDSGAKICNGTDAPVERVDPLANFRAAVTRKMIHGEAFHAEQRMTRLEALRAATLDAAYAAFEDDIKGSLIPGKLADLTVLSEDILSLPEERLSDARVSYTIVGGEVLFEREGS